MTEERSWVETAPRAAHYQIVATSAVSNLGPLAVVAFAFQTLDGGTITTSLMLTEDSLKQWKHECLRAYDEAVRQVRTLRASVKDDRE